MMSIQELLNPSRLKQVNGRLAADRTPAEEAEAREAMRRHLFGTVVTPSRIPSARPDIVNGKSLLGSGNKRRIKR